MNLLNFRFIFLDQKGVTVDHFDNLASELTILGQNFWAGTLEIFPQPETFFLGSCLGLSVFFGTSGNGADTGKGPVDNLGKTFAKESLSNVAVGVENGSNLEERKRQYRFKTS